MQGQLAPIDDAAMQMERMEVDILVSTAKRYPRDEEQCIAKAVRLATTSERGAAECLYALPRSGTALEGLSVRAAEILAAAWGHMQVASRILCVTDTYVEAQAVCFDAENNNRRMAVVRHKITRADGSRMSPSVVDSLLQGAMSKAERNAVMKTVPASAKEALRDAVERKVGGTEEEFPLRRKECIAGFAAKLGVTKAHLTEFLGKEPSVMSRSDYVRLKGVYNAVIDDPSLLGQFFPGVKLPNGSTQRGPAQKPKVAPTGRGKATTPAEEPTKEDPVDPPNDQGMEPNFPGLPALEPHTDDAEPMEPHRLSGLLALASELELRPEQIKRKFQCSVDQLTRRDGRIIGAVLDLHERGDRGAIPRHFDAR